MNYLLTPRASTTIHPFDCYKSLYCIIGGHEIFNRGVRAVGRQVLVQKRISPGGGSGWVELSCGGGLNCVVLCCPGIVLRCIELSCIVLLNCIGLYHVELNPINQFRLRGWVGRVC